MFYYIYAVKNIFLIFRYEPCHLLMHDTFQSQMTEAHVGIHTDEERHDTKTASNDIYII